MFLRILLATAFSFSAFAASDCKKVKPFKKQGIQKVHVEVDRIFWNTKSGLQEEETICKTDVSVTAYDVRGRGGEAFDCLSPLEKEIVTCKTTWDGESAEINVVPAIWKRTWKPKTMKEYRFHAYVTKSKSADILNDIFARQLSTNLKNQTMLIEGGLKTGAGNKADTFQIRAEFR